MIFKLVQKSLVSMLEKHHPLYQQHASIKRKLEADSQLMPEAIHGLAALYLEEEDFTCFAAKKLYGKREKGEVKRVF